MKRIVLLGPRSVGKTTIGNRLAKLWNAPHFDVAILETLLGKSTSEIISVDGSRHYREVESEFLASFSRRAPAEYVLSTGGGTVASQYHDINRKNLEILKELGFMVHITTGLRSSDSASLLAQREMDRDDGFLTSQEVKYLYEVRRFSYKRTAAVEIATTDRTIDEIVKQIDAVANSIKTTSNKARHQYE